MFTKLWDLMNRATYGIRTVAIRRGDEDYPASIGVAVPSGREAILMCPRYGLPEKGGNFINDANLVIALHGLAPEMARLWEAAAQPIQNQEFWVKNITEARKALDLKAKHVFDAVEEESLVMK